MVECKICKSKSQMLGEKLILQKFKIKYYQCENCEFIQTETPYWLEEAYSNPIANTDVGLVNRNLETSRTTKILLKSFFDKQGLFIDYAGGFGLFVRLMRDLGFRFKRYDIFTENIFSKAFNIEKLSECSDKIELITAFEVFEHLENPNVELDEIFSRTENLFFTTTLLPDNQNVIESNWHYLTLETGQHISFYSKKTLYEISKKYGLNLYTHGVYHLFTKKKLNKFKFKIICSSRFQKFYNIKNNGLKSLLWSDYQLIKNQIK